MIPRASIKWVSRHLKQKRARFCAPANLFLAWVQAYRPTSWPSRPLAVVHVRLCRAAPILKTEKKHYLFFVLQKEGLSTCAALLKMGGRGGGGGGAAPTTKLIKKLCRNLCLHAFSIRAAARKMGRGGRGGGRGEGGRRVGRTAAAPPPRAVRVELRSAAKQ
jgi:hypothetical protein